MSNPRLILPDTEKETVEAGVLGVGVWKRLIASLKRRGGGAMKQTLEYKGLSLLVEAGVYAGLAAGRVMVLGSNEVILQVADGRAVRVYRSPTSSDFVSASGSSGAMGLKVKSLVGSDNANYGPTITTAQFPGSTGFLKRIKELVEKKIDCVGLVTSIGLESQARLSGQFTYAPVTTLAADHFTTSDGYVISREFAYDMFTLSAGSGLFFGLSPDGEVLLGGKVNTHHKAAVRSSKTLAGSGSVISTTDLTVAGAYLYMGIKLADLVGSVDQLQVEYVQDGSPGTASVPVVIFGTTVNLAVSYGAESATSAATFPVVNAGQTFEVQCLKGVATYDGIKTTIDLSLAVFFYEKPYGHSSLQAWGIDTAGTIPVQIVDMRSHLPLTPADHMAQTYGEPVPQLGYSTPEAQAVSNRLSVESSGSFASTQATYGQLYYFKARITSTEVEVLTDYTAPIPFGQTVLTTDWSGVQRAFVESLKGVWHIGFNTAGVLGVRKATELVLGCPTMTYGAYSAYIVPGPWWLPSVAVDEAAWYRTVTLSAESVSGYTYTVTNMGDLVPEYAVSIKPQVTEGTLFGRPSQTVSGYRTYLESFADGAFTPSLPAGGVIAALSNEQIHTTESYAYSRQIDARAGIECRFYTSGYSISDLEGETSDQFSKVDATIIVRGVTTVIPTYFLSGSGSYTYDALAFGPTRELAYESAENFNSTIQNAKKIYSGDYGGSVISSERFQYQTESTEYGLRSVLVRNGATWNTQAKLLAGFPAGSHLGFHFASAYRVKDDSLCAVFVDTRRSAAVWVYQQQLSEALSGRTALNISGINTSFDALMGDSAYNFVQDQALSDYSGMTAWAEAKSASYLTWLADFRAFVLAEAAAVNKWVDGGELPTGVSERFDERMTGCAVILHNNLWSKKGLADFIRLNPGTGWLITT